MYSLYIDNVLWPLAPEKIVLVGHGKNRSLVLTEGHEVNLAAYPHLKQITCDVFLPDIPLPFAQYESYFQPAAYYIRQLSHLLNYEEGSEFRKWFEFQLVRDRDGKMSIGSNDISMKVCLENYTVTEDAHDTTGVSVHMVLKEYREMKTVTIAMNGQTATATALSRPTKQAGGGTYTVVKGDTLWGIAKKKLNNASRSTEIYEKNAAVIEQAAKAHHQKDSQKGRYLYPGTLLVLPSL